MGKFWRRMGCKPTDSGHANPPSPSLRTWPETPEISEPSVRLCMPKPQTRFGAEGSLGRKARDLERPATPKPVTVLCESASRNATMPYKLPSSVTLRRNIPLQAPRPLDCPQYLSMTGVSLELCSHACR